MDVGLGKCWLRVVERDGYAWVSNVGIREEFDKEDVDYLRIGGPI